MGVVFILAYVVVDLELALCLHTAGTFNKLWVVGSQRSATVYCKLTRLGGELAIHFNKVHKEAGLLFLVKASRETHPPGTLAKRRDVLHATDPLQYFCFAKCKAGNVVDWGSPTSNAHVRDHFFVGCKNPSNKLINHFFIQTHPFCHAPDMYKIIRVNGLCQTTYPYLRALFYRNLIHDVRQRLNTWLKHVFKVDHIFACYFAVLHQLN